jgi:hypothetical protein
MDELDRLVNEYRVQASSSVKSRLAVLLDIERIRDARVVPFLLDVLRDQHESVDVRMYAVKRLRNRNVFIAEPDRPLVAEAVGDVLSGDSNVQLQLQAALTLGDFTDLDGVLSRLSAISLAAEQLIDLRYAAFTSMERAGPTRECVVLMRQIAGDETLGAAARSILSAWHVT